MFNFACFLDKTEQPTPIFVTHVIVQIQCIKDGLLDSLVEGTSVRESISNTVAEDACVHGTTSTSINMVDNQPASGQNTSSNECEGADKFGRSE